MSGLKHKLNTQQIFGALCLAGLLAGLAVLISPFVINGGIFFWVSDGTRESDAAWGLIGGFISMAVGSLFMLASGVLAIMCLIGAGIARGIRSQNNATSLNESTSPISHGEPTVKNSTHIDNPN